MRIVAGHLQHLEVFVKDVSNDLDGHVGLAVKQCRRLGSRRLRLDVLPLRKQTVDIAGKFFLTRTFCRSADDDSAVFRQDTAENRLQAVALVIRQLATDTCGGGVRDVDNVATRQGGHVS